MPTFDITSAANERIKRLVRLRDRRHRDEEGVFLVEGKRQLERALAAGHEPLEVYLDGSMAYSGPGEVLLVEPDALARASYRDRSQGVIAVVAHFPTELSTLSIPPAALVLMAESIEKPGNLGAMLRTADAVGADAMIAIGDGVDPFNPNVLRASIGALFAVPLAVTSLPPLSSWLNENGLTVVAASPDGQVAYWDTDLSGSVAILVGSEALGLSGDALKMAGQTVVVPMSGAGDSLNAAVSLALIAYEALRQRR